MTRTKTKIRQIFNDALLQEGLDIFVVDFGSGKREKYDKDAYGDESEGEDQYEEEGGGVQRNQPRKSNRRNRHFTGPFHVLRFDFKYRRIHCLQICRKDIPERSASDFRSSEL